MGFFRKKKTGNITETGSEDPPGQRLASRNSPVNQPIELGTIEYVNLSSDGKHGDFDHAVQVARETGKPIFANFVEWSG